jgi:hypothetical protein
MAYQSPAETQHSARNVLFAFCLALLLIVPVGSVLAAAILIIQGILSGGF